MLSEQYIRLSEVLTSTYASEKLEPWPQIIKINSLAPKQRCYVDGI
jgi:hypothetical protein